MCTRPLTAYWKKNPNDDGKRGITFSRSDAYIDKELLLPCGKCPECRRKKINEWAVRCVVESSYHEECSFITLTYDDKNLPEGGTLKHEDWQNFMKRLRRHMDRHYGGKKLKFFMCGEYGGKKGRAHFHAIIFGHWFKDTFVHKELKSHKVYRSPELEKIWTAGFSTLGEVHYGTCSYVAKYAQKRMMPEELYYEKLEELKPYYQEKRMEYLRASQGIGKQFCIDNALSLLASDSITIRQRKNMLPRIFLNWLEKAGYAKQVEQIRVQRARVIWKNSQYTKIGSTLYKMPVNRFVLAQKEWIHLIQLGISSNFRHLNPKRFKNASDDISRK